jgi:hypothetical protein
MVGELAFFYSRDLAHLRPPATSYPIRGTRDFPQICKLREANVREIENRGTQAALVYSLSSFAAVLQEPEANRRAREWSLCSLKRTTNQLKEEMARFDSRAEGTVQKS